MLDRNTKTRVYGYKTANGDDLFTNYTLRGFVVADSLEEALEHFGLKVSNGYTLVCQLTYGELADTLVEALDDLTDASQELLFAQRNFERATTVTNRLRDLKRDIDSTAHWNEVYGRDNPGDLIVEEDE